MFVRKGLACLAALVVLSGCYTYTPVRPADAVLETRVRATVSPEQAAELAPVLRGVTPQVIGTLIERDGASVMLEVALRGAVGSGLSTQAIHNRVSIPFSDLVTLERRQFSTWRTAVSVGAVITAVAGSWAFIGGGSKIDDKQKTDVDSAIIPLFSIPFTIFP